MTEHVEIVVVGAGPAGLRAAQVLADAGREVLVVERHERVGPKTCAGGLSARAARELAHLGLPDTLGLTNVPRVSVDGGPPRSVGPGGLVRTVARTALGTWQRRWAEAAGATILTGTEASTFDLPARQLRIGERLVRYDHLVGADGSTSRVRRALALPVARAYFAGEFNVPGAHVHDLLVAFESARLATGYFWVFPHAEYTSIGAGAPIRTVRPATVRQHLERWAAAAGVRADLLPAFEGATIEVGFVGCHFAHGVHLVGDAAGLPSPITGEGIHAALVSGEEVAAHLLDGRHPMPKTRSWLRLKRTHDVLGRLWQSRPVRDASFAVLSNALRAPWTRGWATTLFLG